jgi:PAS domain S-box-containing protein
MIRTDRRRYDAAARAALLLLLVSPLTAQTTAPQNVLILHSFERDYTTNSAFASQFRAELTSKSPNPINFIEVPLQPSLVGEIPSDTPVVDFLRSILSGQRLDLVVPTGGPAAIFAQRHGAELFSSTPVLYTAVDKRFVSGVVFGPTETAVAVVNDLSGQVNDILRLLPATRTVVVVSGASAHEKFWRETAEREFHQFNGRVQFEWLNTLSFGAMRERCAQLPPHSAILFVALERDAVGVAQREDRALAELSDVANAPIFSLQSTQLGLGIVGGRLMQIDDLAERSANAALRILAGEPPSQVKSADQIAGPPIYDARELRRWKIDEHSLPSGSIVQFREPTLLERYSRTISVGIAVTIALVLLVLALLVIQFKRRRAEHQLRESEERFRVLSDTAPIMVWVAGPDKLCIDFNRPWLEFKGRSIAAELGYGWVEGVHADDVERCLAIYDAAFERREGFEMEYQRQRFDGEYRWVLDTGMPRYGSDGSFLGYIGSCVDVTEHRLAASMLSNLSHRLMEAQEQERAWIARELHDDLCQRIVTIGKRLEGVRREKADDMRRHIKELIHQMDDLARDTQAISHRLHSSRLEILGVAAAAASFCRELSEQHNVAIDFTHESIVPGLPKHVSLGLFRVLQEALNNAVKHSGANRISVSLLQEGDEALLTIADNGHGFAPDAAMRGHGLGLISMRERIGLIKGAFEVKSKPGKGTTIVARVPLRQAGQTIFDSGVLRTGRRESA